MNAKVNSISITLDPDEAFQLFQTLDTAEYNRVKKGDKARNLQLYNILVKHFDFNGMINCDGSIAQSEIE